jgi:hypothetical protein
VIAVRFLDNLIDQQKEREAKSLLSNDDLISLTLPVLIKKGETEGKAIIPFATYAEGMHLDFFRDKDFNEIWDDIKADTEIKEVRYNSDPIVSVSLTKPAPMDIIAPMQIDLHAKVVYSFIRDAGIMSMSAWGAISFLSLSGWTSIAIGVGFVAAMLYFAFLQLVDYDFVWKNWDNFKPQKKFSSWVQLNYDVMNFLRTC